MLPTTTASSREVGSAIVTDPVRNDSSTARASEAAAPVGSDAAYHEYQKVVAFIAVWVGAVVIAVGAIGHSTLSMPPVWERPGYTATGGYTKSLALLYLPLLFLVFWSYRNFDRFDLRPLLKALWLRVIFSGTLWIALDVILAKLFFKFPDARSHSLPMIWGYSWEGSCSSLSMVWNVWECYPRIVPLEEVLFYLGGAALLTLMYIWASEDFLGEYTLSRAEYKKRAERLNGLVDWSWKLAAAGIGLFALALLIKWYAPFHDNHEGWPAYFAAQLLIVFVPLSALYRRVRTFTNPRAFLFVMTLGVLVSLVWEATLAAPYGWWHYEKWAMAGPTVLPWAELPVEACALWLAVGWSTMFLYETAKIKVLSEKTWPMILLNRPSFLPWRQ